MSFAFGVGIVSVFSAGVVGMARISSRDVDDTSRDEVSFGAVPCGVRTMAIALSAVCFTACAAAMCYGLYLIIPQFH